MLVARTFNNTRYLEKRYFESSNQSCSQGAKLSEQIILDSCDVAVDAYYNRVSYGCGIYVHQRIQLALVPVFECPLKSCISDHIDFNPTYLFALLILPLTIFILVCCFFYKKRKTSMMNLIPNNADVVENIPQPMKIETDFNDQLPFLQKAIDKTPTRYLRAYRDHEQASRRWKNTLKWREANGVDSILNHSQRKFEIIKSSYPHYFHGRSQSNDPVFYCSGKINLKNLLEKVTINEILDYFVFISEYTWNHVETREDGQLLTVIDASFIQVKDLSPETIEILKNLARIAENFYRERCSFIYIVNAPIYFNLIWKGVSCILNEKTKSKIAVLGSNYKIKLAEFISDDQIPIEFGGKLQPLGSDPYELAYMSYSKTLLDNETISNAKKSNNIPLNSNYV